MLKDDSQTFDLVVGGGGIDDGWIGLDAGPKTSGCRLRDCRLRVKSEAFNKPTNDLHYGQ